MIAYECSMNEIKMMVSKKLNQARIKEMILLTMAMKGIVIRIIREQV